MNHRLPSAGAGPAAILLIGAILGGCAAAPSASPPFVPSPSSPADPSSRPTGSPISSAGPSAATDGTDVHVELVHATADAVTVDVRDASASVVKAWSGTPGDGASVEPYTLLVSNDGPRTLRLTWVGGPCDSANELLIDATGSQFVLVQPECSGDLIVNDRILILEFSRPISAPDVNASLQDGLDTPG